MTKPVYEDLRVRRAPDLVLIERWIGKACWVSELTPKQAAERGAALEEAVRAAKQGRQCTDVDLGHGLVATVGPRGLSYRVDEADQHYFSTARRPLKKALDLAYALQGVRCEEPARRREA